MIYHSWFNHVFDPKLKIIYRNTLKWLYSYKTEWSQTIVREKRSFQVDGFLASFLCLLFLNLSLSFPVPLCESKNSSQTNQFSKSPDHCYNPILTFSSVQSLSPVCLFVTPWTVAFQAFLFITNSQSLLKLMSTELVMPSNHLILCRPCLLLPSIFPSIGVFSNESVLRIRWPKY